MIVQFLHSGKQYQIKPNRNCRRYRFFDNSTNSGLYFWNDQLCHRRNYLRSSGDYTTFPAHQFHQAVELVFWGEWEPHSLFNLLPPIQPGSEHPHHIHDPLFSRERAGRQNTDPFVFGECFLYSNCLQSRPMMRKLPNDSLILFGSEIHGGDAIRFVLDTVFVVKESIIINKGNLLTIRRRTSDIFVDAVLRKISLHANHRLYFSAPFAEQRKDYFSFFPCKPFSQNEVMLRPVIPTQQFLLKTPGSFQDAYRVKCNDSHGYWHRLVDLLLREGYFLGTKAYLPRRINIHQMYGQNFA